MPKEKRAKGPTRFSGLRPGRRRSLGVAGRILFANSIMLIGIMVLTTSLLYIQLSQLNTKREQDLLRSAADSVSLTLGTIDEESDGKDFLVSKSHQELRERLRTVIDNYDYDIGAVVPIDSLPTSPSLGSALVQNSRDPRIVAVTDGAIPDGSLEQLIVAMDGDHLAAGESTVRYIDDGGSEGGTMYAISPVTAGQLGLEASDKDRVVGAVIIGNSADSVRSGFLDQSKWLIGIAVVTLLLGIGSSWVTSRGLRRVTGDYGATELGRMLEFYSSVLKAVSEGLLLIDRSRGIVLINAEARDLLDLHEAVPFAAVDPRSQAPAEVPDDLPSGPHPDEPVAPENPLILSELDLPEALLDLLSSGRWARDEIHYTDDRVLVVNQQPTDVGSDTWVVTMRDHTELSELSGELVSVRSFSDSLRSQTHEYANRLHMIVSLLEIGHVDEAIDFAAKDFDDLSRVGSEGQMTFDHPVLSALLRSKTAQAAEAGIEMTVDTAKLAGRLGGDDRDLATVLGNLVDNAFDALSRPDVLPEDKHVHVHLSGAGGPGGFTIEVSDNGPGIDEEYLDLIFERGWSTKHDGIDTDSGHGRRQSGTRGVGLSLVVQAIRRLGGAIDVQGRGEPGDEYKGAVLTVWLPDSESVRTRPSTQSATGPQTTVPAAVSGRPVPDVPRDVADREHGILRRGK